MAIKFAHLINIYVYVVYGDANVKLAIFAPDERDTDGAPTGG